MFAKHTQITIESILIEIFKIFKALKWKTLHVAADLKFEGKSVTTCNDNFSAHFCTLITDQLIGHSESTEIKKETKML